MSGPMRLWDGDPGGLLPAIDESLHGKEAGSNGTVTYTYNPDGTTATKTDAKGIRTEFSYL